MSLRRAPRVSLWQAALCAALVLLSASIQADEPGYGIATPHPLATQVGERILADGGNAFDAAVAVSAALAVVEPYGSGMGGGGFWLLEDVVDDTAIMIDGRERAPLAATADMFLDADGEADRDRALNGPLSAAIPGQPAALVHIAENHGTRELADLLAPAIGLAREGFVIDDRYELLAGFREDVLADWGEAGEVFLVDGRVPEPGHVIRQPELANTLERLARQGRSGFYDGIVAQRMVDAVQEAGGIWSRRDLRQYTIVEREPIAGEVDGLAWLAAPPPSSAGIALGQILHMLAEFDLESMAPAGRIHHVVEAMRRAYHDRARFLGDIDHVDVPVERLTDPAYAAGLAATIHPRRATPSESFPGPQAEAEGADTTHFSVIDADGNRVAATLSLNYPFGSGFMPADTGVVLNNHMDDFTVQPGEPNAYGLVQGEANRIAPGKRMLSSMAPTLLAHEGRLAATGTPGGSRIITTVLLAAMEFHRGGTVEDMVAPDRYHHQYLPDVIEYEPDGLAQDVLEELQAMGHELEAFSRTWGNSQAVIVDRDGSFSAAADPRGVGDAAARGRVGSR